MSGTGELLNANWRQACAGSREIGRERDPKGDRKVPGYHIQTVVSLSLIRIRLSFTDLVDTRPSNRVPIDFAL